MTIAKVIAENDRNTTVKIWAYEKSVVNTINGERRYHLYLPEIKLPKNIVASNNLKETLSDAYVVIIATPSRVVYDICLRMKRYMVEGVHLAYLSKGFCRVDNEILTSSDTIKKTILIQDLK